ncbi:CDP-glucose 4,6-dehydratase [Phaeobacter porticola]|uniref:CDP-glucose 4,6-dehydratase RfbG n=1 Tax=Phaeobacter porticola TaxID=1844006 RepID=A0A1L3I1Z8_9RHOB|nr:CDP-glucose 4,6-dehydratase [Phaeobacter porticola]APG46135.1 CDP-glucose 4,6-dehydratase RfbG [Phaeobacter porticola]
MSGFWQGKQVLVTGHTGFKGAWLTLMLARLGAQLRGLALPAEDNSLFDKAGLADLIPGDICDLRNRDQLAEMFAGYRPDVVFHLAAQPLVRQSYVDPVETWDSNVTGTLNLLELLRDMAGSEVAPMTVVVATTDKVYAPVAGRHAFVETDRLGGHDPYSASKAATELLVASYRQSFLQDLDIRIVTARAGNVIGGGDWAEDRIIPDLVRAIVAEQPLHLRYPAAVRPWQHVLDPLAGYIRLAEVATMGSPDAVPPALNFGPDAQAEKSVADLIAHAKAAYPHADLTVTQDTSGTGHWVETGRLCLCSDAARRSLGWAPRWGFERSVAETMTWYAAVQSSADPREVTEAQIARFEAAA